jgi:hypothetical protein
LSSDDERGVVYVRALSDQQTIMETHNEYFQIAFCSFTNAH